MFAGLVSAATSYSQDVKTPEGFALVELFTSEGCSSCPAAEAALAKIQAVGQQHVYVMEYHVDYWNNLGWKDIYSKHDYTLRQQRYASQFKLGSTYTPQAIINGTREMVGSDNTKLANAISSLLHMQPPNYINVSATASNSTILVNYSCNNIAGQLLNIALVQKEVETNVRRGENSGRKLKHVNVVRELEIVDNNKTAGAIKIQLPPGLAAKDFSVIAYTQQKSNWAISGGAECAVN